MAPCQRVATPDGGAAILCSRGSGVRIICDVCDGPVRRGKPKVRVGRYPADLCPGCTTRYATDPGWRLEAEAAVERNLTVPLR